MKVSFVKMHGAGNDFVMIDDRSGSFPVSERLLAAIGTRGTGIGCEGIILVQTSQKADFRMRFFNPDGTEAELCGNGARCVAAFANEIGAVGAGRMRFETLAGFVEAEIVGPHQVKVWMPEPKDLRGDFVNSGVPHFIVPVDDLAHIDVEGEGRRIRNSDAFAPAGTNVDFVAYRSPHEASLRTYERGVEAESGACGTGAVATAIVGVARYGMSFPVQISTSRGFVLEVGGERVGERWRNITLTGPVHRVFEGSLDLSALDKTAE